MNSFETLRASELYCNRCRILRSVREKLLLILPDGEISVYRCSVCGEDLGTCHKKRKSSSDSVKSLSGF